MFDLKSFIEKNKAFVFLLGVALAIWLGIIFSEKSTHVDERTHNRQIHRFLDGKFEILPDLTTIPGYHVTIASFAKLTGAVSLQGMRLLSLGLALFSIGIFFLIARQLKAENPLVKTIQFIFLPLSFVYFPLLYTDIFSLLWVLLAFYFSLKKRYWSAAIFSLISLLVRQTNIVWILFFWVYIYLAENDWTFSSKKLLIHLRQTVGFVVVFAIGAFFLWLNKGIAFGDKEMQQIGLYRGNLYFLLVVAGLLFWPTILFNFRSNYLAFKNKKFLFFSLGVGIVLALSFVFFYAKIA